MPNSLLLLTNWLKQFKQLQVVDIILLSPSQVVISAVQTAAGPQRIPTRQRSVAPLLRCAAAGGGDAGDAA